MISSGRHCFSVTSRILLRIMLSGRHFCFLFFLKTNNQWILLASTLLYTGIIVLTLSAWTAKLRWRMLWLRRTYFVVYHRTISKHFVPGRDDSDSVNPVGVVLEMIFGHLELWSYSMVIPPYKFNCENVFCLCVCLFRTMAEFLSIMMVQCIAIGFSYCYW